MQFKDLMKGLYNIYNRKFLLDYNYNQKKKKRVVNFKVFKVKPVSSKVIFSENHIISQFTWVNQTRDMHIFLWGLMYGWILEVWATLQAHQQGVYLTGDTQGIYEKLSEKIWSHYG